MLQENKLIINDFISKDKFNLDGLIVSSLIDLNGLKHIMTTNGIDSISFLNLISFLQVDLKQSAYCFINMDENDSIDEKTSLVLFRKIRGIHKIIIYNKTHETLKNIEFFKYINWMRLITI